MEVFASISCASVTTRWLEAVASLADPNARQTVLINVGANKGYMLAMWMALFTQRSEFGVLGQSRDFGVQWHHGVLGYAHAHHAHALRSQSYLSCGVCGACKDRLTASAVAHNRSNGVAHALDILLPNVQLMSSVANMTGVSERVHVHHLAGSNQSGTTKMWIGGSYKTSIQAGRESNALCDSEAECMRGNNSNTGRAWPVQSVRLDDFIRTRKFVLGEVFLVSIDAEGVDALILEGMRESLAAKAVSIVHFEKHMKGYWADSHPERRTLGGVIALLYSSGYECFVEGMQALIPISGTCWRQNLDQISWSNVVCAHSPAMLRAMRTVQMRDSESLVRDWVRHRGGMDKAIEASVVRASPRARCWLDKIRQGSQQAHAP